MSLSHNEINLINREIGSLKQSDISTRETISNINNQLSVILTAINKLQVSNAEFTSTSSQSFRSIDEKFNHLNNGLTHANEDILYIKDQIRDIHDINSNFDNILRTVNEWRDFKDNELNEIKISIQKNTTRLATWAGGLIVVAMIINQFIIPNLYSLIEK